MECERYRVEKDLKTDRSFHRFLIDSSKSFVDYIQRSGRAWVLPPRAHLAVTWVAPDGLRVVANFAASAARLENLQSPVHVIDIDFGKPRLRVESFGGVADFDVLVGDPWSWECHRLN